MKQVSLDDSISVYKRLLGYTKKFQLAFFIAILGNLIYAAMESYRKVILIALNLFHYLF